jgi:dGTPase
MPFNACRGLNPALAPYAVSETQSRGRLYPEPPPLCRSEYQRDRDRIVHCSAFRRLEYKTQVFVNHVGDMFRTRLTHSLEVAQIARTVARALRLNEDLTEAIALAHDLGHTPFGHAGQHSLNACMQGHGGFEHNLQSLRIVDCLEQRYAEFEGLNLTFETREGILKHCSRSHAPALGTVGQRFLSGGQPSLEAQVANIADEIAYNNHDIDDGLRSGMIKLEALCKLNLFKEKYSEVVSQYPRLAQKRIIYEVVRRMINQQVLELIEASQASIEAVAPKSVEEVRAASQPLIAFSESMREKHLELSRFLRTHLYQHYRVRRMSTKADRIIRELFHAFMRDPQLLPPEAQANAEGSDGGKGEPRALRARAIADYIAGMTDRYAILEYQRIMSPTDLT